MSSQTLLGPGVSRPGTKRHHGGMPEGDTVWNTAHVLHGALAGSVIRHSDFRVPALATVDLARLAGRRLRRAAASTCCCAWPAPDDEPGADPALAPAHGRRLAGLHHRRAVARPPGPPDPGRAADADHGRGGLPPARPRAGPDRPGGDARRPPRPGPARLARRARRLGSRRGRAPPAAPARAHPRRGTAGPAQPRRHRQPLPGRDPVPARHPPRRRPWPAVEDLPAVVDLARRLLVANKGRWTQATTGSVRRGEEVYVYGRAGAPCRRCGTPIERDTVGRPVDVLVPRPASPSCRPDRTRPLR